MILVTGAFGFIGGHVVRALIDAGETVVAARHRNGDVPDFLAREVGRGLFVETVDIKSAVSIGDVVAKHGVDSVLHMAAPPLGALSAGEEFNLNMQGLGNVLEVASGADMRRVSLASSVAVYGGMGEGPFREDQPLRMVATSSTEAYKKAEEVLGQFVGGQTSLDVICLRIGNIYGPGYRSLVNAPSRMVHAAAQGVPGPLERQGAPEPYADDGADFCYVRDCARGLQLLHMSNDLKHKVYNVGSGRMSRFGEFAAAVEAARPGSTIRIAPGRGPAHVENAVMDIGRARADVGYAPRYGPREGVADYLEWLQAGHER